MRIKPCWLTPIAFILFITHSYAQNTAPGVAMDQDTGAIIRAIKYYNQAISEQSEIYNGMAYPFPPKANKGSVFFQDKNYVIPASVFYNGTLYKNIPVLYDVYSDVMVASSRTAFNYILRAEKISGIYLSGHHFVYLSAEDAGNLKPGFYDQLYAGRSEVLVKRLKAVNNNVTSQAAEITYTDQSDIYLKKGDKYYVVNSKGAFLDVLKDKKKELNQYLSGNKIKYNKDKEASAASLARYYDQITN